MMSVWRAALIGLALLTCSCSQEESPIQRDGARALEASAATDVPTSGTPTGSDDFTRIAEALDRARLRWSEASISDYRLTIAENRNYWSKGCIWVSIVSSGVVTEASSGATSPASCGEYGWTVEELHDMVSGMLGDIDEFAAAEFGDHHLEVTFDADGVPVAIEFDLANGDDEERSMQVGLAERS